jgi:opacity protein-like surface antigen
MNKMNIYFLTLFLVLTISIDVAHSQTSTDCWGFGFGLSYPKYSSVNITSINSNYGNYYSLQRNFSEFFGIRLKAGYAHMEGTWKDASLKIIKEKTMLLTGDLDVLYYFPLHERITPYLFGGIGGNYKKISNGPMTLPNASRLGYQLNIGAGAEFKIATNWSFVTMLGYHITDNSELDGTITPSELNRHDSYLVLSGGVKFSFNRGIASK